MTRVEVEKAEADGRIAPDGGETAPFRYERYLMPNSVCGEKGEVIKVNVAYKPAGMTDAVYSLGNGTPPKPNARDIVMRVSPKYLELPHFD